MVNDLLWHELEAVKAYFARALSWVTTESTAESLRLAGASEDFIEETVLHPHGPYSFEQIVVRSTIHELNSLCEFALQNAWISKVNHGILPSGEHVYVAARPAVEEVLRRNGLDVCAFSRWADLEKIKELSEGFKHRQRMQPFPPEFYKANLQSRSRRLVDPSNTEMFADYSFGPSDAWASVGAVEEFLQWLRGLHAL
jgi:hypothetical protein